MISATIATLSVFLITFFIFKEGLPLLIDYGILNFIFGSNWAPTNGDYGALPMIIGSISVAVGALIIRVPTGIACAIFLAEIAPKSLVKVSKPAVGLLAGIPSVVYGFFGFSILVPMIQTYILPIVQKFNPDAYTSGYSILGGAIMLAVMILPTIINISENSVQAVPVEYKQGSLALDASQLETMAVILISGNMPKIRGSSLDSVATMTGTIAMEMGYATPMHQRALFATEIILFVFIMLLNVTATFTTRKLGRGSNDRDASKIEA